MFTNIEISNLNGIGEKLSLDFIATSRNKGNEPSIIKTDDNIFINKQIGIVGGNASGKSSIINAIACIGNFISNPVRISKLKEHIELKKDSFNKGIIGVNEIFESMNTKSCLPSPNQFLKNVDTEIVIEMYIDEAYYTYELSYNRYSNDSIIKNEKLFYRDKYNSKKMEELINMDGGHTESQVGYYILHFENIKNLLGNDKISIENETRRYQLISRFYDHYIYNSKIFKDENNFGYGSEIRLMEWVEKEKNIVKQAINIIDNRIKDIYIENIDDNEIEIFFKCDSNTKITYEMLSTGTRRMLDILQMVLEACESKGIFVIDEIENNIHKELVELIIRIFSSKKDCESQLIFTTHIPEIFDIKNEGRRSFRNDQIFILGNTGNNINIDKLSEIKIDGKKIRSDMSLAKAYKDKRISIHPNNDVIDEFLKNIK